MKKSQVLVVEDEADIRDLVRLHLAREGHDVTICENGEEALRMLASREFDLIVLDWMLPGISGPELCKRLRARSNVPVLMLTARTDPADIVMGLEIGADDYVTKPFDVPVFLARVRALLRRVAVSAERPAGPLRVGELEVDQESYKVRCAGAELQLTPSEFKLLAALVANQGRVLSRERLIDLVQGEGVAVVDRTVDTHVFGLRKKLGACADLIETIRGIGYRVRSP